VRNCFIWGLSVKTKKHAGEEKKEGLGIEVAVWMTCRGQIHPARGPDEKNSEGPSMG